MDPWGGSLWGSLGVDPWGKPPGGTPGVGSLGWDPWLGGSPRVIPGGSLGEILGVYLPGGIPGMDPWVDPPGEILVRIPRCDLCGGDPWRDPWWYLWEAEGQNLCPHVVGCIDQFFGWIPHLP